VSQSICDIYPYSDVMGSSKICGETKIFPSAYSGDWFSADKTLSLDVTADADIAGFNAINSAYVFAELPVNDLPEVSAEIPSGALDNLPEVSLPEPPTVTETSPDETSSVVPSETQTVVPDETPSVAPSEIPAEVPVAVPAETPSEVPSVAPIETPSEAPVEAPVEAPAVNSDVVLQEVLPKISMNNVSDVLREIFDGNPKIALQEVTEGAESVAPSETSSVAPSEVSSEAPAEEPTAVSAETAPAEVAPAPPEASSAEVVPISTETPGETVPSEVPAEIAPSEVVPVPTEMPAEVPAATQQDVSPTTAAPAENPEATSTASQAETPAVATAPAETTPDKPAETRTLELSGFDTATIERYADQELKIENVSLGLSLGAQGNPNDTLKISYSYDPNSWSDLKLIDLSQAVSNKTNGGYYSLVLPGLTWEQIKNLNVKIVYEGSENTKVYLDSAWLEINRAGFAEYKISEINETPVLAEASAGMQQAFPEITMEITSNKPVVAQADLSQATIDAAQNTVSQVLGVKSSPAERPEYNLDELQPKKETRTVADGIASDLDLEKVAINTKYQAENTGFDTVKQSVEVKNKTDSEQDFTIYLKNKIVADKVVWGTQEFDVTETPQIFNVNNRSQENIMQNPSADAKLEFKTGSGNPEINESAFYDWSDIPKEYLPEVSVQTENGEPILTLKLNLSLEGGESKIIDPHYGSATEILKKKGRSSNVYLKDDGKYVKKLTSDFLNYKDANGDFQTIDTNVETNNGNGFKYQNKKNSFESDFSETTSAGGDYLKFGVLEGGLTYDLVNNNDLGNVQSATAVTSGNTVTYPNVYPNVELKYTITPRQLLEEYIVQDMAMGIKINKLEQKFSLDAGLDFEKKDDGSITFFQKKQPNKILFYIPKPVMYELNEVTDLETGETRRPQNYGLHFEVTKQGNKYLIAKILDAEGKSWLADSARNYPVVIDSTHTYYANDTDAQAYYTSDSVDGGGNNGGFDDSYESELTSQMYLDITDDDTDYTTSICSSSMYPYIRFDFTVSEGVGDITQVDITWKGYGKKSYNCAPPSFSGETMVKTSAGDLDFLELYDMYLSNEKLPLIYYVNKGKIKEGHISQVIRHPYTDRMVTLYLSNGQKVEATDYHPILVDPVNDKYVEIKNVVVGGTIYSSNQELKVVQKDFWDFDGYVYDLSVLEYHNFLLSAELFVHNVTCYYYGQSLWVKESGTWTSKASDTATSKATLTAQYTTSFSNIISSGHLNVGIQGLYRGPSSSPAVYGYYIEVLVTYTAASNTAPSIGTGPSDGGSSGTAPTNEGGSLTFTATASDTESDNYYLAACLSNSITANNNAAPTCATDNTICVSSSTASGSGATCNLAALPSGLPETVAWYAFVCDYNAASACSTAAQGSGATGSPVYVNHPPAFSAYSNDGPKNPGQTVTFSTTSADSDTDTASDTVQLFVCNSNDFTGTACGVAGETCHSSASASNASCQFGIPTGTPAGVHNLYGYIIDNHSFESDGVKQNTYTSATVNNVAPSIGTGPSDGGSSSTAPTEVGDNVSFSATASDSNNDNYYLAVCGTNSITAVNNGAPTCATDEDWCVSTSTASGSAASCTFEPVADDPESNDWYAFVCDHNAASTCSSAAQGSGDSGSPFYVNHVPTITTLSNDGPVAPGATLTFSTTSDDTDTGDTVSLYVCYTNVFTDGATPGCAVDEEVCHTTTPAGSNVGCSPSVTKQDSSEDVYGFIIDNHGAVAAGEASVYYSVSGLFYMYGGNDYGTGVAGGISRICVDDVSSTNSCVQTVNGYTDYDLGEDGSENYNLCLYKNGSNNRFVLVMQGDHMANSGACQTIINSWFGYTPTVDYFQTGIFTSNGAGTSYTQSLGGGLTLSIPPANSDPAKLDAVAGSGSGTADSYVINNVAPEISNVTLYDTDGSGDLTLTVEENVTPGFTVKATISDDNGCLNGKDEPEIDMTSGGIIVYRSGIGATGCDGAGENNPNNCYTPYDGWTSYVCVEDAGSCTGVSDTDITVTCTFSFQYHADPTVASSTYADETWKASMQFSDDDAAASNLTETASGVEMGMFTAYDFVSSTISYGSLIPGGDSSVATTTIEATGNVGLDANISGTAMTSGGNNISVGQQKYSLSSETWDLADFVLSGTATERELNVLKTTTTATPASKIIYWILRIPSIQASGSYSGTNTVAGITGEVAGW